MTDTQAAVDAARATMIAAEDAWLAAVEATASIYKLAADRKTATATYLSARAIHLRTHPTWPPT